MSIQQEWELAYSKDPKGFDELPGSEKADIIRRFVQAKGAKYGGGKSPQVSQFLESKLNEYQPVAGASQGRISRAIEGLMAGVKAPAGGSIITEAVGGQQDLPGLFDIIDLNKGFQAASLARGGGFEAPVTPKKLEKIATQGEPSAPFIAPDPYYMGGAMVGMAPETTAEALIGGKVGVEAAKRLPYTGEIARRAVQFGAGALTGPIIPGAATGLGVAIAPEERRENVIQMGKEGMLYGSLLSGLGGAAMPGPKPQLPTNPVPRVNLLTPEMAAGAKEAQPVKAAMLKRAAKKAEGQLSKEGAYAVTGITSRQEAEALAREANRVTPYASSGGAFEVRERVGPKGKIIYSVEPFRNEDPYILNSYLNEATQNIRRAASAGPAAAPKGKMSAQITTRPARPMPEVNLAPGARTTPPSAVGARDVTIRPRTPEEYAQLLDITGPSSIPTRGQEAALAAARAGAPAEAAAAAARRAAASTQGQAEIDQFLASLPEMTQPRAQVAPPPPTQGRVRPEATEELFGPLTQEQAAARQLMQEEADAVEAALRAGQTIPVEQPPAPTGMMRQRAPGRTVDISGRTGTAGATLPGGRRAAAPMRAAAAEAQAPAPAVARQAEAPSQFTGTVAKEITTGFKEIGSAAKAAGRKRVAELVEKQGYVEFKRPETVKQFSDENPNWAAETTPSGATRFSPPPKLDLKKWELGQAGPEVSAPSTARKAAPKPAAPATKQAKPTNDEIQAAKQAAEEAELELEATSQRLGENNPETIAAGKKAVQLTEKYNALKKAAAAAKKTEVAPAAKPAPKAAPAAEAPPAPKGKMSKGAKAAEVTPPPPPAPAPTKRAPSKKKEVAQAEGVPGKKPTIYDDGFEIESGGSYREKSSGLYIEDVTRLVRDKESNYKSATKKDTDGRLQLVSKDGNTWDIRRPQYAKEDVNQVNPTGYTTLRTGLDRKEARRIAENALIKKAENRPVSVIREAEKAKPGEAPKPQAEIQFSGTLKDRKTKQSYETVTRQVEDPLGRVPGATKVDTDGRLELRSSDGKTWSVEKPQFSKADFNQINPIGRKTLESGLTKTQARKYAQDYLEGKTPAPKKPAGETAVIGGAKAGEAKTKGARRGAIGTGEKENGKKLIHKEGGEPTDSAVVRFVKGEDGFFNAKKLGESIVKGIGFGVTGVREIIAVAARLIQKIAGDGFRAGFKKAAAGVTRTRAYTAVARTLPRLGDIIETGGQKLIIKPINYTGDLLVDIASRGKSPDSRKFMRQVGEVLRRDRELNVEAVKRILRTPANTESAVFNGLSNAVRRFAIGEFGLSKSMIDMIQSIEDEVLKDLKELLEYTGRLLAKYKDDEDALIQIGKDIEDANYTGNNTDVLEGKRIIGNISKSLLDVGAITQGAYDAYVKDGMSSYLPRIYRKWLKTNEDRSGLSVMFFREVNKDPGLTGYEHRGTTEVMSRRKLNEELAKGVQWRELGRTKQSTEDIARAQKAFDKAEKALEKAEDAVKEAKKNRDRINRIAPLPDGSDAAALRTRKTMAAQKLSVSQERLRIAKRNVEKTKNKLESYDLNERVTVVRDWTEDEMNKWAREWNPIPSMVKLYDTALRDLKNGRMFEYLRTGSDDMGRYSMTPEELGVPTDVKYKIPKQVVDDSGKRWVYLDPDKIAKGGTVARYGKLGGNYVRDDIASYLLFHNQFGSFRRLVSMAKQYTGMNVWKAMKTVWSTTYYINNFFNASPNVELAGGSVTDLPAAFKDIVEDAAIIKMLEDANIIKQGKLARELAASAQSVLKKGLEADGVVTHFTASNALQKAGTQLAKTRESLQLVSQATDDLWRVTLYKGLIERQGLSHADAIKIVRDAIYDSKRVTSPLADAAEIFVPFARSSAWMLDQLVTNSIRNPHKLAYLMAIGKFVPWAATTLAIVAGGSTKEQIAAEEESIEDYLKDAKWPIGWPTKIRLFSDSTGKAYYWDTKNFGGLHTMAAEVGNTGFGYLPQSLGPGGPWWIFLQAVMNKDMYRGEDIRKRDTFGRDITIDSELISSPMSEFLLNGLGPSGAPAAYKLGRSMLGMPEPSGKMISSVTRLLQMGGIKIREVDPEIQIPRSIEKGESAIGKWRAERNKDFRVLLKMEKEGAPESARLKQEERVNRWDAKIEELSREEMERALKLQEGLP